MTPELYFIFVSFIMGIFCGWGAGYAAGYTSHKRKIMKKVYGG